MTSGEERDILEYLDQIPEANLTENLWNLLKRAVDKRSELLKGRMDTY